MLPQSHSSSSVLMAYQRRDILMKNLCFRCECAVSYDPGASGVQSSFLFLKGTHTTSSFGRGDSNLWEPMFNLMALLSTGINFSYVVRLQWKLPLSLVTIDGDTIQQVETLLFLHKHSGTCGHSIKISMGFTQRNHLQMQKVSAWQLLCFLISFEKNILVNFSHEILTMY